MKKQNILDKLNNPFIFISTVLIAVTLLFITLSPRTSSAIFPLKSQAIINSFITETKEKNSIDAKKFWELREFYSPGFFKFSKDGIDQSEIKSTLDSFKLNPHNITMFFSKFESKKLKSLDGFTSKSKINQIFENNQLDKNKIIFENDSTVIFKNSQNQTFIIFILPVSEMKKANGFFDYRDGETEKFLKNKNWINITRTN